MTNGASIKVTDIYNDRLQPCWLYTTTGTALASSTLCTGTATTGTIQDVKYGFGLGSNDNGNVLQIVNNRDTNRTQNFLYDALNRIAQAYTTGTNWGETFSSTATAPGVLPTTPGIDAWGNLTNRSGVTGKTSYESLSVSALTNNQLSGFGYDAAGNMTSNGSASYTYDAENRLTSTAGCTFTYDGDGSRVQKTGCANIYYWHDLGGNSLEESIAGTMEREYAFFGGKRVARRDVATNTVHYFFSDHLGSTSLVTDAVGTMPPQSESDYYPYGGEYVITSPTVQDQNYKFTGKERDSESGLDNFGARYFTSNIGRFMTPDWAARPTTVPYGVFGDPQSLNLYGYVRNDPVSRADADGHEVDLDNKKKADRDETQRRLVSNTSKAEQKLFKSTTDPKTGKTTLSLNDAAKSFKGNHTVAFTRLADAIGQKNVVSVGIHDTFVGADGKSQPTPIGGVTVGPGPGIAGNATVTLNRNGLGAGDMSVIPGTNVPAPMEIVAAHEVMGHALEHLKGGDYSEHHVWEIENQMRQEQGLPPRPPE